MSYWRMCEKCPNLALERNLFGMFCPQPVFTVSRSPGTTEHFTMKVDGAWGCNFCSYLMTRTSQYTRDSY